MRQKLTQWFEVKIAYEKTNEDGLQKKVKKTYVVESLSFTEGEKSSIGEMGAYISGEFEVADMRKAAYREVIFSDDAQDDKWYKVRAQFIILDEKTDKERFANVNFLVQGCSLHKAVKNFVEAMGATMIDYCLVSVAKTAIVDVVEFPNFRKD